MSHCTACHLRPTGFTLIETLVAMTVFAIMFLVTVPGFKRMIDARRLDSYAIEWRSAVALARAEALKRGFNSRVTVRQRVHGDWSKGWCVAVGGPVTASAGDTAGCSAAAGAILVQDSGAYTSSVSVTSSGLTSVSFTGAGEAIEPVRGSDGNVLPLQVGSFQSGWIRLAAGSESRCLVLAPPGLIDIRVNPASCP